MVHDRDAMYLNRDVIKEIILKNNLTFDKRVGLWLK
jgi:hypothetical protein